MSIKTPYYIFNRKKFNSILSNYMKFGDVYYPIKSNDETIIIEEVINKSCNFEVDSIEHIKFLVKKYKINPNCILYSYPILENVDIIKANKLGIKKFVVDSLDEYNRINRIINDANYFVRLNAIDVLGPKYDDSQNKWGLSIDDAKDLIQYIESRSDKVAGISFYLFKEIVSQQSLKNMLNMIKTEFSNYRLDYINIGGGISPTEIKKVEKNLFEAKAALGNAKIIIEPGTPLLNPCIDMVVSVTAVREINQKRFVFINSGIYNGLLDVIIKKRKFEIVDKKMGNYNINTIICGSSSDVSDCLGEYQIRDNIEKGDQLVIKGCGAYSSVMQTNFYRKNRIKMKVVEDV